MQVRDVMTAAPMTIDPEAPVETAVAVMRERCLRQDVFGVCEGCHRAIPLARLRAVPTARRCAACQAAEEAAR
jgi:RNA polymerase-binding transcription factor DksA